MILHPGILSLLIGSTIVAAMVLHGAFLGIRILRRWDINSSSMEQLILERKTYLVSTVMNFVLGFELAATFLFIYTLDEIHDTFVGAMCATGSLNANPIGWYALCSKILVFFLAAIWIGLNRIDQQAEDFPLTRIKFGLLVAITPVILLDSWLMGRYFLGLEPNRITSCCGSLFSRSGSGVAAELASLPLAASMLVFYLTLAAYLLILISALYLRKPMLHYLTGLLAALVLLVAIASIISFISLYIYELPTHHCPFDILQDHYHFIGYPIYFFLFASVLFGLLTGISEPLKKIGSLQATVARLQQTWVKGAILLILLFTLIATWPILFSDFSMITS